MHDNIESSNIIINTKEVQKAIKCISEDSFNDLFIPFKLLKLFTHEFSVQLATLFTLIFTTCIVPTCFKNSTITPIYKNKGPRLAASSYRPISVVNIYVKVFERLLFDRIRNRIENNLCNNQHAYRYGRSCHSASVVLLDYLYKALDVKDGKALVTFLDARKAYNCVSRPLLLQKLINNFNLEPSTIKLLQNYFTDRLIKIKSSSKHHDNPTGLPQGVASAPIFYSCFINDIGSIIKLPFLLYSDDLAVFTSGTDIRVMMNAMQKQMIEIDTWYSCNFAEINFNKTEFMFFYKPSDKDVFNLPNNMIINNNTVNRVDKFKYLGLWLDSTLSFKSHYENVLKRVSDKISFMYSIKRNITEKVMIVMMNAYVFSIIDYGIDIWAIQSDAMLYEIQRKIDRFLINFYLPSHAKKCKKKKISNIEVDINVIYKNCNFLTLIERRDLFVLKYMFCKFKNNDLNGMINNNDKTRPVLCNISHNYTIFKNCLTYRGIALWNTLPKDLDVKNLSVTTFMILVKEWLVSKRKNVYHFYK